MSDTSGSTLANCQDCKFKLCVRVDLKLVIKVMGYIGSG